MSKRALALGIVARLRTIYDDMDGSHFGYQPKLMPPPASGQWYVSVGRVSSAKGTTQSGDVNDQVYTVQIAITVKMGYAPEDRQGAELTRSAPDQDFAGSTQPTTPGDWQLPSPGLEEFADEIVGYLLEDYTVLNVANTYIAGFGTTTNGFVEPFHNDSIGDVEEKPAGWVGWESADAGQVQAITVTMSGARRIRLRGQIN